MDGWVDGGWVDGGWMMDEWIVDGWMDGWSFHVSDSSFLKCLVNTPPASVGVLPRPTHLYLLDSLLYCWEVPTSGNIQSFFSEQ